ncbi:unnamed protein product [Effrenium voratum]|nr:unnamed protein product [Effrenium voratum]
MPGMDPPGLDLQPEWQWQGDEDISSSLSPLHEKVLRYLGEESSDFKTGLDQSQLMETWSDLARAELPVSDHVPVELKTVRLKPGDTNGDSPLRIAIRKVVQLTSGLALRICICSVTSMTFAGVESRQAMVDLRLRDGKAAQEAFRISWHVQLRRERPSAIPLQPPSPRILPRFL